MARSKLHFYLLNVWLASSFVPSMLAQNAPSQALTRETIETRLKGFSTNDRKREEILELMFKEVGCQGEMLREQNVKGVRLPNLICTLPGKKDKTIIVGAHFDHAQIGDGVIDNWSGASMLPSLYESLKDLSREHTFVFIAFTGEEKGLLGSAHYVRQLTPEQVQNTAAMINLDTLGLTSTKVWQSHADEALVLTIERVAGLLGLPLDIVNVEKVGTADSESFASRNIPHITLHSVTQQTLPIVHSAKDNIRAVNLDYYYDSYRLILAYLTDLDSSLLPRPSEPPAAGESKAKAPIPPFLPSSRFWPTCHLLTCNVRVVYELDADFS